MVYDRQYIQDYIRRFVRPKRPELENILLDAFDALQTDRLLSERTLAGIADGASDRHANVYETCTEFLGEAASKDDRALKKIQDMAASTLAHVRHNALLCLGPCVPSRFSSDLIRAALADKSARVRCKAADWAQRLSLREVEPELLVASKVETDQITIEVMRAALRSMRVRRKGVN